MMFLYVITSKHKDSHWIKFIKCGSLKLIHNMKDYIRKTAREKNKFKIIISFFAIFCNSKIFNQLKVYNKREEMDN